MLEGLIILIFCCVTAFYWLKGKLCEERPTRRSLITYRDFTVAYVLHFDRCMFSFAPLEREYEKFNAKWRLLISRSGDNLNVVLRCSTVVSQVVEGCVRFTLTFSDGKRKEFLTDVVGFPNSHNHFHKEWSTSFSWKTIGDRMYWKALQRYDIDVRAQVTINKMIGFGKTVQRKFDKSVKDVSDVVLVAWGRRFYLSRMFLALQSPVLKELLLSNFNNSTRAEIALKKVDPDEFQRFLEVLHGEPSIDDFSIEGILHLAHMYKASTALQRCQNYLQNESQLSMGQKLKLADTYKLTSLRNTIMDKMTADNLAGIIRKDTGYLEEATLFQLLQKLANFLPPVSNSTPQEKSEFPKRKLISFDESVKDCSDIVVKIGTQKFYLSKMFLASQSSVLKSLVFGKPKKMKHSEIEFNDVVTEDFQNLLEVLHGELPVDETVEGILRIAKTLDCPTATRRCEELLMNQTQMPIGKTLQLSVEFNLSALQQRCLSNIRTSSDYQSIINEYLKGLNAPILRHLLLKGIRHIQ